MDSDNGIEFVMLFCICELFFLPEGGSRAENKRNVFSF